MENNQNNISIPTSEVKTLYGDYRTFIKDIDTLIELGFIKQISSGVPTMSISIYGFSTMWKYYGTDKFNIPTIDKRYSRKSKKLS